MTLMIIGDSTSGAKLNECGENTAGWAEYVNDYLDGGNAANRCVVGWGIRDFFNRGQVSWIDHNLSKLDENDTMLACFGTLERSPLSRTDFGGFGSRGSLFGQDDSFKLVYDEHYKVEYKVYTFGEYLRRLAILCRVKGVKLCFLSQIPRNTWENGHHKRTYSIQYAKIMETISKEMNVGFLDTNEFLSAFLEEIGQDAAQELYSLTDKSHTSPKGAKVYAQMIVNKLEL
jgi:lysophospholipase L1-like esterase